MQPRHRLTEASPVAPTEHLVGTSACAPFSSQVITRDTPDYSAVWRGESHRTDLPSTTRRHHYHRRESDGKFSGRVSRESRLSSGAIGEYRDGSYWTKLVLSLGVAKLFVEAGLRCAQLIETAFTGRFSYNGQFVVYGVESAMFCFIPMLYRWFETHTHAQYLLFIGGCGPVIYVYYMAENPGSAHESVGDQIFNFIAFAADALIYPFSVAGAVHLVGRAAYSRAMCFTMEDPHLPDHPSSIYPLCSTAYPLWDATPRIGPRDTALVTGFALLVDGCIAFVYGYLVFRGFCTLRTILLLGVIAIAVGIAFCAALSLTVMTATDSIIKSIVGVNFQMATGDLNDWVQVNTVEAYDYIIVAFGIIIFALGLVPYKAHLISTIQRIYQPTPYYLIVSAHFKGLRSVGFVIQLGIDTWVSSHYGTSQISNFISALVLVVLSILTYLPLGYLWLLERCSRGR
ncbi:hypothetical protein Pmar_PMAR023095 [Perkinsus marinus ATCC 50983]|uniref:Uncharacterized protein n=1 Tax=Perkinsus marinus (strain ATCC 50983 / TXsc) TaxID=423536 RepID=C5LGR3_PERM5|nr:hypothetical protein Pmar_PMAR023095 [Perkinsus marinus ATCC 50983]EER04108.1 hypothetical protein Pmar_PMAR023095 [Perkinsus marinus ATCC 50983]|eukprot:XP_002772292.1 hypothetical protein Pmar_PMAR023095 [Perkinsus marinus ATCC 50983]